MFEGWMGKTVSVNHNTVGTWKGKDEHGIMLELNNRRLVFFTWGMIQTLEILNQPLKHVDTITT